MRKKNEQRYVAVPAPTGWQLNSRNALCGLVAVGGVLQFLGAVVYAARVYPGGYEITEHFLSDLGRTQTLAGLDNSFCAGLFNWSVMILGISLFPAFAAMAGSLGDRQLVPGISGLVSCLALVGIGATPYDVYLPEHLLALGVWMFSTLVLVVSFFGATDVSWKASVPLGIITCCVLGAAWQYGAAQNHSDRVMFQKLLVATCVVWLGFVLLTICVSKVRLLTSDRERREQLAADYLSQIERGHRKRAIVDRSPQLKTNGTCRQPFR